MTASDDKKLWQAYARSVKREATAKKKPQRHPVKKRDPAVLSEKLSRCCDVLTSNEYFPVSKLQPQALADNGRWIPTFAGMTQHKIPALQHNRRTERALRQGAIAIDARLDLHGLTQIEAYPALGRFMAAQVKLGRRNLLIITGKGSKGHSVLRANLPHWLESLPAAAHILELRNAAVKHGGSGAFYVLLKRKKK